MRHLAALAIALSLAAAAALASSAGGEAEDTPLGLVDLGQCNLVVKGVSRVESVKGESGKTIEASKRGSVLLELEIEGTAAADGQFALYPSMFSLACAYRRVNRLIPSLAIGIKPKLPTGEIQEYWLNRLEATMLTGCEKGDRIGFYALFEVPDEVKEFTLQIPVALQAIATDSL
jgi:hypothetical protein